LFFYSVFFYNLFYKIVYVFLLQDVENEKAKGPSNQLGVDISKIEVYQRGDCCQERFSTGFRVEVLDANRKVLSGLPLTNKPSQSFTYMSNFQAEQMIRGYMADKVAQEKVIADSKARAIKLAIAQEEAKIVADKRAAALALAEAQARVIAEQEKAAKIAADLAKAKALAEAQKEAERTKS
jgi:hypothetical protein